MSHHLVLSPSQRKGELRQAENRNPKVKNGGAELNQKPGSLDAHPTGPQGIESCAAFVLG